MSSLLERFKEIAKLNGIETKNMSDIEKELGNLGYNNQEYFQKDNVSIIKAVSANANEANAVVDVSTQERLSCLIDTERLIIIIDKNKIFENMHKAYKEAYKSKGSRYMIFVSQESKTADIEKQLVSGVQGAKTVEFVIV